MAQSVNSLHVSLEMDVNNNNNSPNPSTTTRSSMPKRQGYSILRRSSVSQRRESLVGFSSPQTPITRRTSIKTPFAYNNAANSVTNNNNNNNNNSNSSNGNLSSRRPSCPAIVRRSSGALQSTPVLNSQGGLQYRRSSVLAEKIAEFIQFSQEIGQHEWVWKLQEEKIKRNLISTALCSPSLKTFSMSPAKKHRPETIVEEDENDIESDSVSEKNEDYDLETNSDYSMSDNFEYENTNPSDWFLEDEEEVDDEPSFVILEKEDLENKLNEEIDSTAQQINLDRGDAALVLNYFNWDKEKLLATYFDNPEKYCKEAGILTRGSSSNTQLSTEKWNCKVCFEEFPLNKTFSLGCGHRYCLGCWKSYLHAMVVEMGSSITDVKCMFPECTGKINFEKFSQLADYRDFERYHYFFVKKFVDSDWRYTFCPSPLCGNAVQYLGPSISTKKLNNFENLSIFANYDNENDNNHNHNHNESNNDNSNENHDSNNNTTNTENNNRDPNNQKHAVFPAYFDQRPNDVVECICGTRFCFGCGNEKHNPVSCKQLAEWRLRNQDDKESETVVQATSKPCFHCGIPTERVLGCNHMVCRKNQGGCGGEWCWMCRGDWKTHGAHTGGFYSCNRYEESQASKMDVEAENLQAQQKRFLHYFHRYFNHDMLMKQAIKFKENELEQKMISYRDKTSHHPYFLSEANSLLIECRRILKYTYTLGYYLRDGTAAKVFFEYLQASAEGITERLSSGFFLPVEEIDAEDLKNRIRVTHKFTNNLVLSIEEGLGIEGGLSGSIASAVIPPLPNMDMQNPVVNNEYSDTPASSFPTL
eukprot:TRINITY_DN1067_c0_g1_i1.p1 TRINITY_DN1067_c0_g1~~TRINITY_DN1067_c0_g1_i1.p1  ORF type:complete len:814 (+),score=189.52 TRINITY_DN1067_c0_g1_i1:311-2752(+)